MNQTGLHRAARSRTGAEESSSASAKTTAREEATRLRHEIAILEAEKQILGAFNALGV